jgi:hypothetical protein
VARAAECSAVGLYGIGYRLRVGRHFRLKQNCPVAIHNTQRRILNANIQSNKIIHYASPFLKGEFGLSEAFREV